MAAVIRQTFEQANSGTTAVTSQTGSFSSPTLVGSTIVVFGTYHYISSAATCSDTANGSYTQSNTLADTSSKGMQWLSSYYYPNAVSTSSITFSHASTTYSGFIAMEITGLTLNSFAGSSINLQTGITGSTSNNLNTANFYAGAGYVFIVGTSMMTTENGTSPYVPFVGAGYTLGGHWFESSLFGGASLATWQYATVSNPGSITPTFTSPTGSANDNFLSAAMAFSISTPFNPLGGNGTVAWVV